MGVDQNRTLVQTMLLAASLSGLCGVLTTLFYGGVGYAGGLITGLKALIAAIIGGIGSIPGALVGGLLLGVAETMWAGLFQIEYRDPAIFIGLAVLLWLRPGGLFGHSDWPSQPER
jgi:branched-chain amino acid transport system permease protein